MKDSKIKTILKEKVRSNKFLLLNTESTVATLFFKGVTNIGRKHFLFEVALRKGRGLKRIDLLYFKIV